MTVLTIETTAELLRALEQDPSFRSQVRRVLFTEELLQLPSQVALYIERQETWYKEQKATNYRFESALKELVEVTQRNSDNIARLTEATQRTSDRIERLEAVTQRNSDNIAQLTEATQRTSDRIERLEAVTQRNSDNIAQLTEATQRTSDRIERLEAVTQRNSDNIARLTEATQRTSDRIERLEAVTQRNSDNIARLTEATQRTSDRIERLEAVTQHNSDNIARLTEATQRNSDNIDNLSQEVKRINNSIGELKGNAARRALNWHFGYIADAMGFRLRNTLTRHDRWDMAHRQDISDIPVGQRRSFYEADLVMEVTDRAGEIHYIAVEASYTADTRDSDRAIRNAKFLTRFTGRPAHAAVVGRHYDYTIQALIEEKESAIHWYPLKDEDFTPD